MSVSPESTTSTLPSPLLPSPSSLSLPSPSLSLPSSSLLSPPSRSLQPPLASASAVAAVPRFPSSSVPSTPSSSSLSPRSSPSISPSVQLPLRLPLPYQSDNASSPHQALTPSTSPLPLPQNLAASTTLSSLLTTSSLSLLELSETFALGSGRPHIEIHDSPYDFEPLGTSQHLDPSNSLKLSTEGGGPEGGSIRTVGEGVQPQSHLNNGIPGIYKTMSTELKLLRRASLRLLQQLVRLALSEDRQRIQDHQMDDEVVTEIASIRARLLVSMTILSKLSGVPVMMSNNPAMEDQVVASALASLDLGGNSDEECNDKPDIVVPSAGNVANASNLPTSTFDAPDKLRSPVVSTTLRPSAIEQLAAVPLHESPTAVAVVRAPTVVPSTSIMTPGWRDEGAVLLQTLVKSSISLLVLLLSIWVLASAIGLPHGRVEENKTVRHPIWEGLKY